MMGSSDLTLLMLVVVLAITLPVIIYRLIKSQGLSSGVDVEIKKRGDFTKRIVVWDFLSNSAKLNSYENAGKVGIWLNYPKRFITVRLDRDAKDVIDIPFDKIQGVEIIEDGYTKTTGGGVGVGFGPVVIGGGGGKSKEIATGLQVRIVTGGINGVQPYTLKLFDPKYGYGKQLLKSHPEYKAIQECARSIVDELENIMRYSGQ